jgi:signal-transduction protein with cAMP-binding, CBS, and nucleotidyltransferase domain
MQIKECVLIEPYVCKETDTVVDVAKKLRETVLRHIFVVNDAFQPTGIISVVDINNRVVAVGANPSVLKAKDIMSKPVDIINISDDTLTVSKAMMEKGRAMCPVAKDGKMVGIITINELLRHSEAK